MSHSVFKHGDPVEVIKNNCYYPASVIRPPSKNKNLVFLEYRTLFLPSHPKRLRQYVNVANVRPDLPLHLNPSFKLGDAVDTFCQHHGAWCPATVVDVLQNSTYLVAFPSPDHADSAVVHRSALRLHRSWLRGNWVPPLPGQVRVAIQPFF
ncbi:unnamed protein product [Sphenostylis stenocarpa]|uniref:Agenet domain-containing protein n=1 Tax=Sphenostylis stenocarpa TaxID=92480 RepID=A0AA86SSB7_9FABA|nr:unnamed protein product [Sphenostylis stenocarpa]